MLLWIIRVLIIGLIAGWLANKLMHQDTSDMGKNLGLGVIGSIVGSLVGDLLGLRSTNLIGSIILAVIGACLAEWIYTKYLSRH